MVTVLRSSRSVPPLAISLYDLTLRSGLHFAAERMTRAVVNVVLPWSMWPMVPTLTCGFVRSKTSLAIVPPLVHCKQLGPLAHFGVTLFREGPTTASPL